MMKDFENPCAFGLSPKNILRQFKIEQSSSPPSEVKEPLHETRNVQDKRPMSNSDRRKLIELHKDLVNDVKYYEVSSHLLTSFVITQRMHEDINSVRTEHGKMEKLLEILPTRGDVAIKEFSIALEESYPWFAEAIKSNDNDNDEKIKKGSDKPKDKKPKRISDMCISDHVGEIRKILEDSPVICRNWRMLAYSMKIKHSTVRDIEEANRGRTENAIHEVLQNWMDETGENASFENLVFILESDKRMYAAEQIKKLWVKAYTMTCHLS